LAIQLITAVITYRMIRVDKPADFHGNTNATLTALNRVEATELQGVVTEKLQPHVGQVSTLTALDMGQHDIVNISDLYATTALSGEIQTAQQPYLSQLGPMDQDLDLGHNNLTNALNVTCEKLHGVYTPVAADDTAAITAWGVQQQDLELSTDASILNVATLSAEVVDAPLAASSQLSITEVGALTNNPLQTSSTTGFRNVSRFRTSYHSSHSFSKRTTGLTYVALPFVEFDAEAAATDLDDVHIVVDDLFHHCTVASAGLYFIRVQVTLDVWNGLPDEQIHGGVVQATVDNYAAISGSSYLTTVSNYPTAFLYFHRLALPTETARTLEITVVAPLVAGDKVLVTTYFRETSSYFINVTPEDANLFRITFVRLQ
jgi:hypothetical protein